MKFTKIHLILVKLHHHLTIGLMHCMVVGKYLSMAVKGKEQL